MTVSPFRPPAACRNPAFGIPTATAPGPTGCATRRYGLRGASALIPRRSFRQVAASARFAHPLGSSLRMVRPAGFEPATCRLGRVRSTRVSRGGATTFDRVWFGAEGGRKVPFGTKVREQPPADPIRLAQVEGFGRVSVASGPIWLGRLVFGRGNPGSIPGWQKNQRSCFFCRLGIEVRRWTKPKDSWRNVLSVIRPC